MTAPAPSPQTWLQSLWSKFLSFPAQVSKIGKVYLYTGIAILAIILGADYCHAQKQHALAEYQQKQAVVQYDSVTKIEHDTLKVFIHDTLTLTKWKTQVVTLHDTVEKHLTDTVLVKQYIAIQDSTIDACTRALHDCGTIHNEDQQRIADLQAALAASKAENKGGFIRSIPSTLIKLGVGFGSGYIVAKH